MYLYNSGLCAVDRNYYWQQRSTYTQCAKCIDTILIHSSPAFSEPPEVLDLLSFWYCRTLLLSCFPFVCSCLFVVLSLSGFFFLTFWDRISLCRVLAVLELAVLKLRQIFWLCCMSVGIEGQHHQCMALWTLKFSIFILVVHGLL